MAQKQFIIDGGFTTNADSSLTGNLDMTGHIIPTVDSDGTTGYDLGSPSMKWRDLYLSQGSLYIDGQKVIESNSGTIVVQADPGQSLTTKVSGSGVMTLESETTVTVAATLQMQTGKRITDQGGNAVVFGDKLDMDNNQIINIGSPTSDGHVASKSYVDSKFDDVLGGAPAALDTLNELANALGDDANYAASITNALATKASTAYVDSEISTLQASANAYTDSAVGSLSSSEISSPSNGGYSANKIHTTSSSATMLVYGNSGLSSDNASVTITSTSTMIDTPLISGSHHRDTVLGSAYRPFKEANIYDVVLHNTTPTDNAHATSKSYVDSEISTLSASVAAGAYGDGDVRDFLTEYDSNIVLFQSNTGIYLTSDATENNVVIKNNGGQAFVYANKIQPFGAGGTDLELEAKSGGKINVNGFRVYNVGTPTNTTDAANKSYVDLADSAIQVSAYGYTDTRETAITTAFQSYADQAEADAIASAEAKDVVRAASAEADATSKANAAQSAAESYTDAREVVITTAYQAADTSLTSAINTEKSRIDAIMSASTADKDTFAEIVNFVNSVDTANDSALGTEITTRAAADTALSGRLDVVEGSGAGSVAKAQADAIASAEAKDVVRASAANAYADQAEADAIAAAEAKDVARASAASADAQAKANAAQSAAIAASAAALTSFHSAIADVTDSTDLTYTFSDLIGAKFYQVFLNRQLLRPAEYSVNLTTGVVTLSAGVIATGDEIEVNGFKA